jgi:hypothetical protein
MKILYDHQIFTWQKFGGISRYFYELMNHSKGLFDYEVSGIYSWKNWKEENYNCFSMRKGIMYVRNICTGFDPNFM